MDEMQLLIIHDGQEAGSAGEGGKDGGGQLLFNRASMIHRISKSIDCGRKFVLDLLDTTSLQCFLPGRRRTWEGKWKVRAG